MPTTDLKLGVIAAALSPDARHAVRLARQMGFAGVQFDAITSTLDLTDLSGTGRREFRHALSNENQELVGLRTETGPKGFGLGADIDRILSRVTKVMEAAVGLQAPLVCLELGPLPPAPARPVKKKTITAQMVGAIILPDPIMAPDLPPVAQPPDPTFVSQVEAALAQLGQAADRFGATVALRSDLSSFASLEHALRRAACPWFGVDLDPVAILRDEWDIDEICSRFGEQIRHVRGRDALGGAERRTTPAAIGSGSTDWPDLLAHLDAAGYRGWITVDPMELPDRPAGAAKALGTLKG